MNFVVLHALFLPQVGAHPTRFNNTHIANVLGNARTYSGVYDCASSLDKHNHRTSELDSKLGWSATKKGVNAQRDWMMLDLGNVMTIVGTVTQGRASASGYAYQYVSKYAVSYSRDNGTWTSVETTFHAKTGDSYTYNWFSSGVKARFVKFFPLAYNSHPTMRGDVIVQYVSCTTPEKPDTACAECEHHSGEPCKIGDKKGVCWQTECVQVSCTELGTSCDACSEVENSYCDVLHTTQSGVCKGGKCAITTSDNGSCVVGADSVTSADVLFCFFNNAMGECVDEKCVITCLSSSHECQKGQLKDSAQHTGCPNEMCSDNFCCEIVRSNIEQASPRVKNLARHSQKNFPCTSSRASATSDGRSWLLFIVAAACLVTFYFFMCLRVWNNRKDSAPHDSHALEDLESKGGVLHRIDQQ